MHMLIVVKLHIMFFSFSFFSNFCFAVLLPFNLIYFDNYWLCGVILGSGSIQLPLGLAVSEAVPSAPATLNTSFQLPGTD